MKKGLLSIIGTMLLGLVAACSSSDGSDKNSAAESSKPKKEAKLSKDVIAASSIISLQEAEEVLQMKLEALEIDQKMPAGKMKCVYGAGSVNFQVFITQDALMTGLNLKYGGAKNSFYELVKFQKKDSPNHIFEVKNLGEEAWFMDLAETNQWSLHILQSGYLIMLQLDGFGDKEQTWQKLKDAGELAVKKLLERVGIAGMAMQPVFDCAL